MATKKKLLQAAAGSAGGAGPLNVEDVFSSHLYVGNGSSQVIENGINLGQSYGSGGIDTSLTSQSAVIVNGDADFGYGTGDFTIELWVWINKLYDFIEIWDQRTATQDATTTTPILYSSDSGAIFYFHSSGNKISSNNGALSEGAWNHIALTRYGGSTKLFVDGTQVGNTYFDSTNYVAPVSDWSFGGSLAQGQYNLDGYVSNARVVKGTAVYTGNFTVPTSELTNITNTVLLTAQGSTPLVDNSSSSHTVTTNEGAKASTFGPFDAAEAGEGGLVWFKSRTSSANSHKLFDTERGALRKLHTDETIASTQETDTLSSFNANGFSILSDAAINSSTADIASWTFRKAPKFFTCLTYTGTGTAQNISHDLGTTVGTLIVKRTDSSDNWTVWHRGVNSGSGSSFLNLNLTSGYSNSATRWNSTAPTSTQFSVGTHASVNASGGTYVAYLFAHNDGDGEFGVNEDQDIIKCGTYTGNGGTQEIDIGFEPQWILVKNVDSSTANWVIFDAMINWRRDNGQASYDSTGLEANTSDNEASGTFARFHPSATGFGFISEAGTWLNTNGNNYIYMAIRRGLMATPEDATKVFAIDDQGESTAPYSISNFPVDFVVRKNTTGANTEVFTRLTQNRRLIGNSTNAEDTDNVAFFDFMNGTLDNTSTSTTRYSYMWRRANGFCDVVSYAGNGNGDRQISHNLGVAPEMIWVKVRNTAGGWVVYHSGAGNTDYAYLNQDWAFSSLSTAWNNTTPTANNFTVGSSTLTNGNGDTLIAYLFGSVDGVSKVGSFTGQNDLAYQTIDCGFTNGARFVLLKRKDATGDWFMFDTVRGSITTSANDTFVEFNTSNAQDTETSEWNSNVITSHSSGFRVVNNFNILNHEYVFYAIA